MNTECQSPSKKKNSLIASGTKVSTISLASSPLYLKVSPFDAFSSTSNEFEYGVELLALYLSTLLKDKFEEGGVLDKGEPGGLGGFGSV